MTGAIYHNYSDLNDAELMSIHTHLTALRKTYQRATGHRTEFLFFQNEETAAAEEIDVRKTAKRYAQQIQDALDADTEPFIRVRH